MTVETSHDS